MKKYILFFLVIASAYAIPLFASVEVKVHWTDTAIEHLSFIHDYIDQNSTKYAQRVVDRLTNQSQ